MGLRAHTSFLAVRLRVGPPCLSEDGATTDVLFAGSDKKQVPPLRFAHRRNDNQYWNDKRYWDGKR